MWPLIVYTGSDSLSKGWLVTMVTQTAVCSVTSQRNWTNIDWSGVSAHRGYDSCRHTEASPNINTHAGTINQRAWNTWGQKQHLQWTKTNKNTWEVRKIKNDVFFFFFNHNNIIGRQTGRQTSFVLGCSSFPPPLTTHTHTHTHTHRRQQRLKCHSWATHIHPTHTLTPLTAANCSQDCESV